ncbi:hypothetical protein HOY80DRAFT_1134079 [Tuber brumale]|nr:hypothetical protein HOY80DRAFT_1134079 [Tuber brumale]
MVSKTANTTYIIPTVCYYVFLFLWVVGNREWCSARIEAVRNAREPYDKTGSHPTYAQHARHAQNLGAPQMGTMFPAEEERNGCVEGTER